MKKRNIKSENERVEKDFPKNPNNISKDELHEHFDLNQDGKVTIDEYAEHINYHCDNPETLSDELDYERGFKYEKGGKTLEYEYEDIGKFSIKDENWKYFSNDDFKDIGKEITDTAFNGDLDVAYESIVKQRDFENGGKLTEYEEDILEKAGRKMNQGRVGELNRRSVRENIAEMRKNPKSFWREQMEGFKDNREIMYETAEDTKKEANKYVSDDEINFGMKALLKKERGGELEQEGMGGYDEYIMSSNEDKLANSIIDNTQIAKPFRAIGEGGSKIIIGESRGDSRKNKQKIAAAVFAPHKLYAMYKADKTTKTLGEEFKKGGITKDKAKLMLEDGVANGKPLTSKQKKYFRAISNGAKYSKGGYTKEGVRLREALAQMKSVKDANGLFVYNPYYEKWGWLNDTELEKGILPYRVAVNYKKNDTKGKGSLENVNDLIVVREGYYREGGICGDNEYEKREKLRNIRKMKKGGSVLDNLNEKWKLQDEIIYLEDELRDVESEIKDMFSDMKHEGGQKGEEWTDDDANRYGEKMNKAETRKESIKKLIKDKMEKWDELEQS